MASDPITSWKMDGETVQTVATLDNTFHKRFEERENKLFKAGKTLAFKVFCKQAPLFHRYIY